MTATTLFITEYIEGSSNNKALEIFNGTGAAIDLAAWQYVVQIYFNGNTAANLTINLTGTVAAGDVFVLAHSSANATILAQADQTNSAGWFNGNDAIVLRRAGATGPIVDSIGTIGVDPGTEWGAGLVSTADNSLRRKGTISSGDTNPFDFFDPALEWEGFATDTFTGLGSALGTGGPGVPLVSVTAVDATASEADADPGTFRIARTGTLTDPLTVSYTLIGSATASDYTPTLPLTATIPAGQSAVDIVITPVNDAYPEGAETVALTLLDAAAYNLALGTSATIILVDDDTQLALISAVQGSGATSPRVGQAVTVEAIVVGDFQTGGFDGFYLQEEATDQDGNPLTSEGLFIFQGSNTTAVQVGDKVRVTGIVAEYTTGTSSLTQLKDLTALSVLSSGNPLPEAASLNFPVAGSLEAYEGMRVQVPGTLTVTGHYTLGRYGDVLLSSDGPSNQPGTDARLDQYTQFNLPSVSGYSDYLQAIASRRIVLDDGSSAQNPEPILYGRDGRPLSASNTLRGGDTATGLIGVLDDRYGAVEIGNYRIHPTQPVEFNAVNPRQAAPEFSGNLRVAVFNVLNYFNGDGAGGGFPTARGADNPAEFERQQDKIVAALLGLDADVIGLAEIENDGFGSTSAIQSLVNELNAAIGAGTYTFINPGLSRVGSDAITVGLIYKSSVVSPIGGAAILDSSFVDPDGGGFDSSAQRPSLAQTFELTATGARFTPVVNHFKAKGTAASGEGNTDAGDGQGLSNGTRTRAADTLVDWLATDPTQSGDADFLILGDLNAYAMEDPVRTIQAGADNQIGGDDDFVNLIDPNAYSYAFDGQWGTLEYALGSLNLVPQVTAAATWRINADEPGVLDYNLEFKSAGQQSGLYAPDAYRSSDHDPLVVALNLGFTRVGTAGNDLLMGSSGNDRLAGGAGIDVAVYSTPRTAATLVRTTGGHTVNTTVDGTDTLSSVERLQFSDINVALDLAGNAGKVAKILGAVFGKAEVANGVYAGIGLYYIDGGMTYESLMRFAIDARLGTAAGHDSVVDLLYTNVVGAAPGDADRSYFVGLLDSGAFTVPGLGVYAADYFLNLDNINLVGLTEQGLEYAPYLGW